jgi:hypothetical protein
VPVSHLTERQRHTFDLREKPSRIQGVCPCKLVSFPHLLEERNCSGITRVQARDQFPCTPPKLARRNKPTEDNQMRMTASQSGVRGYQESCLKREFSAYFRHISSHMVGTIPLSFFGYINSQTYNHCNCRSYRIGGLLMSGAKNKL